MLFVGFNHVYCEETAMTLKTMALVAFPMHAMVLNVSAKAKQLLVGNHHTQVGFVPISCTQKHVEEEIIGEDEEMSLYKFTSSIKVPLKSGIRLTADSVRKKRRMRLLHETTKVLPSPL